MVLSQRIRQRACCSGDPKQVMMQTTIPWNEKINISFYSYLHDRTAVRSGAGTPEVPVSGVVQKLAY